VAISEKNNNFKTVQCFDMQILIIPFSAIHVAVQLQFSPSAERGV
jgi:hypothetical protein